MRNIYKCQAFSGAIDPALAPISYTEQHPQQWTRKDINEVCTCFWCEWEFYRTLRRVSQPDHSDFQLRSEEGAPRVFLYIQELEQNITDS